MNHKEIYTAYAAENDMTFIMCDTYENASKEKLLSTEVIGFYFGEPTEEATKEFPGSLKADFT